VSVTVGLSRAGSPWPARRFWLRRAGSGDGWIRWLPFLAPTALGRAGSSRRQGRWRLSGSRGGWLSCSWMDGFL